MKKILLFIFVFTLAHAGERNVLVEMFTNSHCSVCPGAHSAINSYLAASPNAKRLRFIYYHTTFPYGDDQLSLANTVEPNARNAYYNGPTSTPNTFFDGANQGRTYSSFAANLDARLLNESPLTISLQGTKSGQTFSVTAAITQSGQIAQSDLVLHMVAVEHVSYVGRNGVSPQNYVMRKMITPSAGDPLTLTLNVSKQVTHSAQLTNVTDLSNAGIVVFVQSVSTKEVFQSEYIPATTLTSVGFREERVPQGIVLEQNYPNPFNPTTIIKFRIQDAGFTTLTIYDAVGREAAILVNRELNAGEYHYATFDAQNLSGGLYFARLQNNGKQLMMKMLFMK